MTYAIFATFLSLILRPVIFNSYVIILGESVFAIKYSANS